MYSRADYTAHVHRFVKTCAVRPDYKCLIVELHMPVLHSALSFISADAGHIFIHECKLHRETTISYGLERSIFFPAILHVRPAKTEISLYIRPVWSESLQGTLWAESVGSQGYKASSGEQRRHRSACASAQADLSLRWALMQSCSKMLYPGS